MPPQGTPALHRLTEAAMAQLLRWEPAVYRTDWAEPGRKMKGRKKGTLSKRKPGRDFAWREGERDGDFERVLFRFSGFDWGVLFFGEGDFVWIHKGFRVDGTQDVLVSGHKGGPPKAETPKLAVSLVPSTLTPVIFKVLEGPEH